MFYLIIYCTAVKHSPKWTKCQLRLRIHEYSLFCETHKCRNSRERAFTLLLAFLITSKWFLNFSLQSTIIPRNVLHSVFFLSNPVMLIFARFLPLIRKFYLSWFAFIWLSENYWNTLTECSIVLITPWSFSAVTSRKVSFIIKKSSQENILETFIQVHVLLELQTEFPPVRYNWY